MILPNNPHVDPEDVERQLRQTLARRRETPLPAARQRPPAPPEPRLSWRQRLKRIPVLGASLVFLYHRWRRITAPGIGRRERIKALPLVGDLCYFLWVLADLPRFRLTTAMSLDALRQDQQTLVAQLQAARQDQQEQHRRQGLAQEQLHAELRESVQRLERLNQKLAERNGALEQRNGVLEQRSAGLEESNRLLEQRLAAWQSAGEERLAMHSRALRLLEQRAAADAPAPSVGGVEAVAAPVLGNFYLEFETRFRGSPESVKERQRPYLPYLRAAVAGVATPRCVDIGCGRGEWLELLREQGLNPLGIDLDPGMVLACRDRGLDARQEDGIAWLRAQAPDSLDLVSAFQVIEHLSLDQFLSLLDATLEALAPGGIAIFETPNPENLIVGACNFYYDPTHRNPIPPPVAAFIAEQRGFPRVEILRLNPYPDSMLLEGGDIVSQRLNGLLYGPQDYALIVGKRHADD
ncbi:class I SAM-dependent methyltransferase [Denitratisoma oestradiolicum]|uniref:Methyltransferase domain-containing protein n=1 Tax=Denitratisoma oestradiolicum TaxID=311182 RepID=A0A6S6YEV1_9PROT|nr:methyltransferase domain-containing protein [Denitratisoma oestradiolicum]TWO80682.1 hypothetical protein CBW56_07895 [Denitratisoma oestradiolicum]CAB1371088.1 conserved protein of unknown function [Denitratisoma oestradiolicum]